MTPGRTRGIHLVFARTAHTFDRHTHEDFGVGVITAGAQRWRSGPSQVEAGAGSAIAVNAGEVHDGSSVDEIGRTWHMLYINATLIRRAAGDVRSESSAEFEFASPVLGEPGVADLVLNLFASEVAACPEPMQSEELLLATVARTGAWRVKDRQLLPIPVALAKQRIDDDPTSNVSLGVLAQLCGVSKFQLLRSFARTTGLTPHAYIIQRRIDLARRLIAQGQDLADAAVASGFADQSHMTRTFVRRYGLPPGAYARACR